MAHFTRRRLLAGAGCVAAGVVLAARGGRAKSAAPLEPALPIPAGRSVPLRFTAAERPTALPCFGGHSLPMWTFSEGTWPPVVRIALGDRLDVTLENRLPRADEHTSIHWHGIRLPNAEDGVPYLVQPPVEPGGRFDYSFVPPDTGTFWFHTHCNTVEQLGRGLMGILIVEGDTTAPYDADEIVLLRDWRVDRSAGAFLDFTTKRGVHRAGTYGTVRSANGMDRAPLSLPAGGDCRLRVLNCDPTRVMEIAVEGAEAAVIAVDGIAVPPFALDSWLFPPAARVDLVVRAPPPGRTARLVDRRAEEPLVLADLSGVGAPRPARPFEPAPLRAGRIAEPDLGAAETLPFVFASRADPAALQIDDPLAKIALGSLCRASEEFWSINGESWPGRDHSSLPPPIARLSLGRTYRFTLKNGSQIVHPIHIHGHSFKVLGADLQALPVHHADTVLLLPGETVDVAFVADNPGKWMFHCHVIEHQEAGMMSYLEVT
ncbi:MAG: multicopper oxidase family protein [Bauldia sp.]|nr:multicopper oxidase family protein [Bauldia sp.]